MELFLLVATFFGTLAIGVPGFHIAPLDCRQPSGADR